MLPRWEALQPRLTGALVIVAIGMLLRTVGVAHLHSYASNPMRTFEGSLVQLVSLTGWASLVVIAGYWFSRRDLPPSQLWRIAIWCFTTMVVMVAFTVYIIVEVSLGGGWFPDPEFTLLLGANVGAGIGTVLGWHRVRAVESARQQVRQETRAELLERQARVLTHLNHHLQHHALDTVTVVNGYADLLTDHVDDEGRRHLGTIRERNHRTVELLTNVDALVRALGSPPTLVTRDLSVVLVAEISAARRASPHAVFDVEIPAGVAVYADDLLDVVLANLLQNAVDHTDEDRPLVCVRLTEGDEGVRLTVADDGPGIPAAVKRAFTDTDGIPDAASGTGLGLSLAAIAVRRYGSELQIRDGATGGTVISFDLPRAPVEVGAVAGADGERVRATDVDDGRTRLDSHAADRSYIPRV